MNKVTISSFCTFCVFFISQTSKTQKIGGYKTDLIIMYLLPLLSIHTDYLLGKNVYIACGSRVQTTSLFVQSMRKVCEDPNQSIVQSMSKLSLFSPSPAPSIHQDPSPRGIGSCKTTNQLTSIPISFVEVP